MIRICCATIPLTYEPSQSPPVLHPLKFLCSIDVDRIAGRDSNAGAAIVAASLNVGRYYRADVDQAVAAAGSARAGICPLLIG